MITYYLKIKFIELNNTLASYLRQINYGRNYSKSIYKIIQVIDKTYYEIDLYNRIYWCKFLGIFWLTIRSLIALLTFVKFLGNVDNLIVRVITASYLFNDTILLLFIIHISNNLYNKPIVTYKLINSYLSSNRHVPLVLKFKVYKISL